MPAGGAVKKASKSASGAYAPFEAAAAAGAHATPSTSTSGEIGGVDACAEAGTLVDAATGGVVGPIPTAAWLGGERAASSAAFASADGPASYLTVVIAVRAFRRPPLHSCKARQ